MILELKDKAGTVLKLIRAGTTLKLPSGDRVSPTADGWSNGEYSLSEHIKEEPVAKPKAKEAEIFDPNSIVSEYDVYEILDNL